MKRATVALTLSLLVAACSTRRPPVPPPTARIIEAPVSGQVMSPRTYVTSSASFDLFVLAAAELAQSRAVSSRVRAQANAELADHRGLSAQLSYAGRGLNLLPPRAMWKSDFERLAGMRAASNFDAAYKKQMIAAHQHQLKISRDGARRGTSPTLRPVARNAADTLARHLKQLEAL